MHTPTQSMVCYVFSLLNDFIQYIHTYQSLTYPVSLFLYHCAEGIDPVATSPEH